MKIFSSLLLIIVLSSVISAQVKKPEPPAVKIPFEKSLQAFVVTTKDWDATTGTGAIFERKNTGSDWRPSLESCARMTIA